MNRTLHLSLALLLAASPARAQVSAEPWLRAGTLMLTFELGGAAFTDFQRAQARSLDDAGSLPDFQRRVSARTSATLGASAVWWMGDSWALRVGGAWVPTHFSVWNEESAQRVLDERGDGNRETYARLSVWMADVAMVFRFPRSFGRVTPYGIVGGSYVAYRATDEEMLPPEARRNYDGTWATPAGLLGIGAFIPLQRKNLLLAFELTDHIGRTPLDDQGRGETFELSGIPLQLDPDPRSGTDGVGLTSNLRLAVGLTLPIR